MSGRSMLLGVLALVVASTACEPLAQEAGPLSEEDVAAIEASRDAFAEAVLAGDWAAVAALYTGDAVFMPPNEPAAEGRGAIQARLEPLPPFAQFEATIVEIDGRGDLALVRATYSETIMVEGTAEPIHDTGKYVEIWRKQPDGSWLIAVEIWNSDQPLPEQAAAASGAVREGAGEHERSQGGEQASSEARGERGEGAEGGEHGSRGEGEESGERIGPGDTWDATRNGARLILSFDPASNAFVGTVENTTRHMLCAVRVEVHLSTGTELGPLERTDLLPGEKAVVRLPTAGEAFDSWTAHPETSPCAGV